MPFLKIADTERLLPPYIPDERVMEVTTEVAWLLFSSWFLWGIGAEKSTPYGGGLSS
jgi:hypothetical protein